MDYNDLGDCYFDHGDLKSALNNYVNMQDYCSTPEHVVFMCINVIRVCIEMDNYNYVKSYVAKAESTLALSKDDKSNEQSQSINRDELTSNRLLSARALSELSAAEYKNAARSFLKITAALGRGFSDFISLSDVALYGTITALSSLDREELKRSLQESPTFLELVENQPATRQLASTFLQGDFSSCLSTLSQVASDLALDPFMAPHTGRLLQLIRQRCLVDYITPYCTIDLNVMAARFNTTLDALEKELVSMIGRSVVEARIDLQKKVLYTHHENMERMKYVRALALADAYCSLAQKSVLRWQVLRNDLEVPLPSGRDKDKRLKKELSGHGMNDIYP